MPIEIPSPVLARLQMMFLSGITLEEAAEALELETSDASGTSPAAEKAVAPAQLEAIDSVTDKIGNEVAELAYVRELRDYPEVLAGIATIGEHVLALRSTIDAMRGEIVLDSSRPKRKTEPAKVRKSIKRDDEKASEPAEKKAEKPVKESSSKSDGRASGDTTEKKKSSSSKSSPTLKAESSSRKSKSSSSSKESEKKETKSGDSRKGEDREKSAERKSSKDRSSSESSSRRSSSESKSEGSRSAGSGSKTEKRKAEKSTEKTPDGERKQAKSGDSSNEKTESKPTAPPPNTHDDLLAKVAKAISAIDKIAQEHDGDDHYRSIGQ